MRVQLVPGRFSPSSHGLGTRLGYYYLESRREGTVYGGVACTERKYEHLNIAVSETCFLGALLQH